MKPKSARIVCITSFNDFVLYISVMSWRLASQSSFDGYFVWLCHGPQAILAEVQYLEQLHSGDTEQAGEWQMPYLNQRESMLRNFC